MGQSINVLLYGVRVPDGVDVDALCEKWEDHALPQIQALLNRLRKHKHRGYAYARQPFVPERPHFQT